MIQPLLPAHPSSASSPLVPRLAVPSLWPGVTAHPSNVLKFPLRRRSRPRVILDRVSRSCLLFDVRFYLKANRLLCAHEMTRRAKGLNRSRGKGAAASCAVGRD